MGASRQARGWYERELKLLGEGAIELVFGDQAVLEEKLVRRYPGKAGENGGLTQGLGRVAIMSQEAGLDRQRC
jgi:hypothetical protein